jgi:hypothetical protein
MWWVWATVAAVAVALFLYVRASRAVRGACRAVACRAACARLVPRQGALLVILRHYRDASRCASLYHALMRTASCPRRVFVAVYQELGPGDVDVAHLVHRVQPATDRLRVVTVEAGIVGPAPLARAVQQVLSQALRGERTTLLLAPDTVPGDGWDERLLDDLAVARSLGGRAVLTAPQPAGVGARPAYPTWAPGPRPGSRALAGPDATTPTAAIRASTAMCVAPSALWQRSAADMGGAATLSLSAAMWAAGGRFFAPRRNVGLTGGTEDTSPHRMKPAGRSLRLYGEAVGVRFGDAGGTTTVSGRAGLGLTRRPTESEVVAKFGSTEELARAKVAMEVRQTGV